MARSDLARGRRGMSALESTRLMPLGFALPVGFAVGEASIAPGDDRHVQGRLAARRALEALGAGDADLAYEGTRPVVLGAKLEISITHGRTRALAVVAPVAAIGIDLCDDDERLAHLAERFLAAEQAFATSLPELAVCFAAKEAALKALGLGLLDGGMFDNCAVQVLSLEPPRLEPATLQLVVCRVPEGAVAVVYRSE